MNIFRTFLKLFQIKSKMNLPEITKQFENEIQNKSVDILNIIPKKFRNDIQNKMKKA